MYFIKSAGLILVCFCLISSCAGKKDKGASDAQSIQQEISAMKPGQVATSSAGYLLTAKINGKPWSASFMYPPEQASRIVGENEGISIGLPYDRRDMTLHNTIRISHDNAVDLFMPEGQGGIMGGYEGEIEITNVGAEWAEGRFQFTATSDGVSPVKVTEGYFRVPVK